MGFFGAGILITKSYKEWQENPIATSITTHPIDNLNFPKVTICPPKDSNTALYHDLVTAGNKTLSDESKDSLRKAAYDIFIEQNHKDYVKKMLVSSHMGNLPQILQSFHSLPEPYNDANGLKIKMWDLNGTIMTPWFAGDYVEEYYLEDREFLFVIELPDDIKDQVGSGSLIIDLDVDTREESGWVEEVTLPSSTLHTTLKTWSEADLACKREGRHLASVTSDALNQVVKNLAPRTDTDVWLGGKKKLGRWTWSDNSTWGFTSWDDTGVGSVGDCVASHGGFWSASNCGWVRQFLCQRLDILKGRKSMSMAYTKDMLDFPSFTVLYKYKDTNRQLLDNWKDKRMTGLRLSWRIESENPPMVASVNEVGRSIQTSLLGDASYASLDHVYKAVLAPSNEVLQNIENQTLVIELENKLGKYDKISAHFISGFKLYSEATSWTEAEARCHEEGGQLASINSKLEQTLAEKAVEGIWESVWLGGRKVDDLWQWTDKSSWGFTNWGGFGFTDYEYLVLTYDGTWETSDSDFSTARYFLCKGKTVTLAENGVTSVELEKEQLPSFPFHVLFKSQAISQPTSNTSSTEKNKIPGFTLNWFLKDSNGTISTEKLPARKEDWNRETPSPAYKEPVLYEMVELAKELRLQSLTREDMLTLLIHKKSQTNGGQKCSMDQVKPRYRYDISSKVLSSISPNKTVGVITKEDIETGYELFHALVFCPAMAVKIYTFIDQLLSNETSRTIIQTIVNLYKSDAITDDKSLALTKHFYQVLASILDLQYGNILLATLAGAQMRPGIIDPVEKNSQHDTVQDIYKTLGELKFFSSSIFCSRCEKSLSRAVPPPGPPDS